MKVISNSLIDIYGELAQASSWITAKDLAEATNLSRPTVNRCLNYLIQEGLVVYKDVRPAWLYKLMSKPKNPKLLARLKALR
ncbi:MULTISPECIES: winged helix-turn-helix transcriptional regulator [unclassified Nostoc]|uniref:winged helix-turn-helix transcriptional regulator n=1 Tax=unclassified Nostoc TaxID=2593658 RepID=UPI002AD4B6DD|nr:MULTISPECIES: winged helix-turn-helix transcriptional regulator [unclassified Nostoc]MDZ8126646.1 winged helix-turn-helix transcriptional regulator [Nostoc sp. CmiVER01]MDZ8227870.1 winged helix-turn-helix transcriptional regulator [Nostoc sp. ChiVER01]